MEPETCFEHGDGVNVPAAQAIVLWQVPPASLVLHSNGHPADIIEDNRIYRCTESMTSASTRPFSPEISGTGIFCAYNVRLGLIDGPWTEVTKESAATRGPPRLRNQRCQENSTEQGEHCLWLAVRKGKCLRRRLTEDLSTSQVRGLLGEVRIPFNE